jgi:hypothetical protein
VNDVFVKFWSRFENSVAGVPPVEDRIVFPAVVETRLATFVVVLAGRVSFPPLVMVLKVLAPVTIIPPVPDGVVRLLKL